MKGSLQDWASLAEIVGAVAIVVSLVYVATEIRENTKALNATSRQSLGDNDLTYFSTAIDSTIVAVAKDKFFRGEEITSLEMSQLKERQHLNFRIFENAYSQYRLGAVEEKEWDRYSRIISLNICDYLPARLMWAEVRTGFETEFMAVVDEIGDSCEAD
jgi:hypothetical protein